MEENYRTDGITSATAKIIDFERLEIPHARELEMELWFWRNEKGNTQRMLSSRPISSDLLVNLCNKWNS